MSLELNKAIARPKFSYFKSITESLLDSINNEQKNNLNFSIFPLTSDDGSVDEVFPVGFDLKSNPIKLSNSEALRFRHDDEKYVSQNKNENVLLSDGENDKNSFQPQNQNKKNDCCYIHAVYFPLISLLLKKWFSNFDFEKFGKINKKKVLVLVTGRGVAQDEDADDTANSTQFAGQLIKLFFQQQKEKYNNLEIVLIHSDTDLFRNDENIYFVKNQLLPIFDSFREDIARNLARNKKLAETKNWKDFMNITLSLADGAPARTNAINASLKHYRFFFLLFFFIFIFFIFTFFNI
jgi:hypothetical protein